MAAPATKEKKTTPRRASGPALTWNGARDSALVSALVASRGDVHAAVDTLRAHPAYADVKASVNVGRVRGRAKKLRSLGVAVDVIGARYAPNVEELSKVAAGSASA